MGFSFFLSNTSVAEPWLANRYSKNCAACHNPGRLNRVPIKRRCTLSCQGCHVSPQGGGIRNHYGKWNQERWLKSFKSKHWVADKHTPAPRNQQPYAKAYPKKTTIKKISTYPAKVQKKIIKGLRPVPKAKYIASVAKDEKPYTKEYDDAGMWMVSDKVMARVIPKGDPYWLERNRVATTNAEFRYFYLNQKVAGQQQLSASGIMSMDFGVRFRPLKEKVSIIYEARVLNSPTSEGYDNFLFPQNMITRSAYVLVDDLAYNSFAQIGWFRPMLGYHTANHSSLRECLVFGLTKLDGRSAGNVTCSTAGAAQVRYQAISVGSAPNVPYFNAAIILPGQYTAESLTSSGGNSTVVADRSKGFVLNTGLRFVSYGLSAGLSAWSFTREDGSGDWSESFISFNLGGAVSRIILNAETLYFGESHTVVPGRNSGLINTVEAKARIWRESYLTFGLSNSNTALNRSAGRSRELSFGVKMFPISGVEIEAFMTALSEDYNGSINDTNRFVGQVHMFF